MHRVSTLCFLATCVIVGTLCDRTCPGFCIPEEMCRTRGDKVLGLCKSGGSCCEAARDRKTRVNCGNISQVRHNTSVTFKSPGYPLSNFGSLVCSLELGIDPTVTALRLDLIKFELDGILAEESNGKKAGVSCDSDMFFIKGFSDWMPEARCGQLSGYSLILDLSKNYLPEAKLTFLFVLSSQKHRWNIRIEPLTDRHVKKSELCLTSRMQHWQEFHDQHGPSDLAGADSQDKPTVITAPWETWIFVGSLEDVCNNVAVPGTTSETKYCKSTIVDDRHVLTTVNCLLRLRSTNVDQFKIVRGSPCDSNTSLVYTAKKVFLDFNYLPKVPVNDLVMLRTRQDIQFSKLAHPITVIRSANSGRHSGSLAKIIVQLGPQRQSKQISFVVDKSPDAIDNKWCESDTASRFHLSADSFKALLKYSEKYWSLNRGATASTLCYVNEKPAVMGQERHQSVQVLPLGTPILHASKNSSEKYAAEIVTYQSMPRHLTRIYNFASVTSSDKRSSGEAEEPHITYVANLNEYKRWILIAIA